MTSGGGDFPEYEVAVVGSRGFLGQAMVRSFDARGIPVAGFGLEDPIVTDGVLNPRLGNRPLHTVVWCASRINPRLAAESPELVDADVDDLLAFLEAAGTSAPHVILLSSGGTVYGPPALPPFSETDEPAPVNAYGAAKLRLESILRERDAPATSMRISNAYGPGQRPAPGQGVLAHWMQAVREGEPVSIYGDPQATRDYVYVDDIAAAAVAVHLARDVAPPVVNIGSGVATTLDDLLSVFSEVVSPVEFEVNRTASRSTDTSHSALNVDLAREVLGWESQTSLADGIRAQWQSLPQ